MNPGQSQLSLNNWRKVFLNSFLLLFLFAISLLIFMYILSRDLPSISELKSFNPEQISKIISSAKKTKKILFVDNGWKNFGIGAEIISSISENIKKAKVEYERIGIVQTPIPSTISLAKYSYPNTYSIIKKIEKLIKRKIKINPKYVSKGSPDQPDNNFLGPF